MCSRGWTEVPDRCRLASIPERVGCATKPALATAMLGRALDAGVSAAWVVGDEVYSADRGCCPSWSAAESARYWRWPATTGWWSPATPSTRGPGWPALAAGAPQAQTGELALYRCWTPRPVLLVTLVRVAGRRWTIEKHFQTGKGLCGLDSISPPLALLYRWTTLAMLATPSWWWPPTANGPATLHHPG